MRPGSWGLGIEEDCSMRRIFVTVAMLATLGVTTVGANAQERAMTGAAIGAGAGLLVLGPIGAVAGGAVGAYVGGPRITRVGARKKCWRDRDGERHCRSR
jgi:hypothetical protein